MIVYNPLLRQYQLRGIINAGYINYTFSASFMTLPLSAHVRLRVRPIKYLHSLFLFLMTQFYFTIAFG